MPVPPSSVRSTDRPSATAVLWFRRDLRLEDHPALAAAAASASTVLPLFVIDPALWGPSGDVRRAYLVDSLRALDASLEGRLHVRTGRPAEVLPQVAREVGTTEVHVSADHGPYGARRDADVERALAAGGVELVRTGSPYAVSPGRVRKPDGTPYAVFTPFHRAWVAHGWRAPLGGPSAGIWAEHDGGARWPTRPDLGGIVLPAAGERAARARWADFLDGPIHAYADARDRPDLAGTSQLSAALRWGELHPRTLLADLSRLPGGSPEGAGSGPHTFGKELAWREFYADVLGHDPASARRAMRPAMASLEVDTGARADELFAAWSQGCTGYPFVDAGMRQLLGEGWMHNRVRMVVASFLVKDLHLDWTRGARWFLHLLRDGDLASNQHGWQWVAGTGTDAAPYFRVFNPVTQGRRYDPDGDYVRRWVPELRGIAGAAVHEPWRLDRPPPAYPAPIVDHAEERAEALRRAARAAD